MKHTSTTSRWWAHSSRNFTSILRIYRQIAAEVALTLTKTCLRDCKVSLGSAIKDTWLREYHQLLSLDPLSAGLMRPSRWTQAIGRALPSKTTPCEWVEITTALISSSRRWPLICLHPCQLIWARIRISTCNGVSRSISRAALPILITRLAISWPRGKLPALEPMLVLSASTRAKASGLAPLPMDKSMTLQAHFQIRVRPQCL